MDALEIYRSSLVWDDHGGFTVLPGQDLGPLLGPWHAAGVDYLSVNVGIDAYPPEATLQAIAWVRHALPEQAPFARLVGSVGEIDAARADGKMAVTFDIEGMSVLGGRPEMIGLLHHLGVRHMNFAYNLNNAAGSGCHDEDTGLTDLGRAAIDEMNRVGMVVDCTHCGYRTTMEAMERSSAPVNFTHSNPRALHDHGRNIMDDQIRACAATGGVIGINGINLFLGVRTATPADVARHAAYVAELTSTDHVGLCLDDAPTYEDPDGADFLFVTPGADRYWPVSEGYSSALGCLNVRHLPEVAVELAELGFDGEDLGKILGGNFRRVAETVWKSAKPPSHTLKGT